MEVFLDLIAPQSRRPSGKYFHKRPSISSQQSNLEAQSVGASGAGGAEEARLALIRRVSRTRKRGSLDDAVAAVRVWEGEPELGLNFMVAAREKAS